MGQLMLTQGNLDFHTGIGVVAKHFNNSPDRLRLATWLFQQFHHHHLAGFRARYFGVLFLIRRQQNILTDALVFGHYKPHTMLLEYPPDEARIRALYHLDDFALGTAFAVNANHSCNCTVTVQDLGHFLRR